MNPNSKQFKKLQKEWYKKLAKDGFDDIETGEQFLKRYSNCHFLYRSQNKNLDFEDVILKFKSLETYFRLAGYFFNEYDFKDEVEKLIWAQHADGISYRDIAQNLKLKNIKTSKTRVHNKIDRLKKIMFERYKDEIYDEADE